MKKFTKAILAGAMCASMLAGCGAQNSIVQNSSEKKSGDDLPTIVWWLRYDDQKDQAMVSKAVDEIAVKNIGCHVQIKRIESGDYSQKLALALAGQEDIDICHMAPRYNFYSHAAKGAFLPLDELIEKYAKDTYNDIPEAFWDAAKINGEIYGIPNYQIVGRRNGFVVLKSLLDKYNFDLSKVTRLEDMEPFFEAVKNGEDSNMRIFSNAAGAYEWGLIHYIGLDPLGSEKYPAVVRCNDESLTVVNQFETEEFASFCNLMRKWYIKGYNPQQGSSDNSADLEMQGLSCARLDNIPPGYIPTFKKQRGGRDVDTVIIDPPFVNTSNVIATMNCVSKFSKNPDKAVQFINMVDQNIDNVYNILCYGIEGVHYNKIGENRIEKIENSGYDPNMSWEFGNNFNAYLYGEQEDNVWEETKKVNETAIVSNVLGFSPDTEPIKTEMASCEAVIGEYLGTLTLGAVDPEEKLPEFQKKLKQAGVDKVIEEFQKQIDEWKASK